MEKISLKNFFKKNKTAVMISAYGLFLVLVFVLGVRPIINSIQAANDQFQKKFIEQKIAGEKIKTLPQMEVSLRQYEAQQTKLNGFFQSNDEVEFIQALEAAAEATQTKIKIDIDEKGALNKEAAVPQNNLQKELKYKNYFLLKISTEGTYANFLNFVYQLEHFQYFVNVLSVSAEMKTIEKTTTNYNPFDNSSFGQQSAVSPQGIFAGTLTVAVYTR